MKRFILVNTPKGSYGPSNPLTIDKLIYIGDVSDKPGDEITQNQIDEWNEAFGWGDHSQVGYITINDVKQDAYYEHIQAIDENVWMVMHNLGKRPSVNARDVNDNPLWGVVTYLDMNTLTISFNTPFSGFAELN